MSSKNVCIYFKFRFYKFKSNCRLSHIEEECQKKYCFSESCNMRHSKPCFYWVNFGDCKLEKHKESEKVEGLEKKMEELIKKDEILEEDFRINNLRNEVKDTKSKNEGLEKKIKEKEDVLNDLIQEFSKMKAFYWKDKFWERWRIELNEKEKENNQISLQIDIIIIIKILFIKIEKAHFVIKILFIK